MTDAERKLLLTVAAAVRFLDFDGVVPKDLMIRLAAAEADLRVRHPEQLTGVPR